MPRCGPWPYTPYSGGAAPCLTKNQAVSSHHRFNMTDYSMRALVLATSLSLICSGCAVVSVGSAAVTVVSTTVSVGATVVGTAVDVAAAGVRAVVGGGEEGG